MVIDVSHKCEANHLYELSLADVQEWEAQHGRIPQGVWAGLECGGQCQFFFCKVNQPHGSSGCAVTASKNE